MKKIIAISIIALAVLVIVIQFIPKNLPETSEDRTNDFILLENPPEQIKEILTTSCYDCHSNQTVYPWYSYVAPFSWLVVRDVREGRKELNFSEWGDLSKRRKVKLLGDIAEEVESGEMPMKIYTLIHRDARLDDDQVKLLTDYTKSLSSGLFGD